MTKRGRTLPARRQHVEDALLIRSAESLGRIIGTLQRQLDGASKQLSSAGGLKKMFSGDGHAGGDGHHPRDAAAIGKAGARKRSGASSAPKGGSKSGATKVRSTPDRKSKRASKSAAAKNTAGRSRSGASRKTAK